MALSKITQIIAETPIAGQDWLEYEQYLQFLQDEIKPKIYVEVGTYFGASLTCVKKLIPECRCIGIDVKKPSYYGDSNPVGDKYLNENYFEFINLDSTLALTEIKEKLGLEKADVIFIDADHHFDAVYRDWINYRDLGKIIVFHDIRESDFHKQGGTEVSYLWYYLKYKYKTKEFLNPDPKMFWAGIGVVFL